MKKPHLIFLSLFAIISIGFVVIMREEESEYVDFATAKEMAKNGKTNNIHVAGTLPKDTQGNILGMKYQPMIDSNYLELELVDLKGFKEKVYCFTPKPIYLEKSDKAVVVGNYQQNKFIVNEILIKVSIPYGGFQE
ncbi:MAG: cytochrome c maturation protein CcmE [Cytophagales bacterium]|nr:cytochrome c maturation protein CcmE [Cytophagales bacterium]